MEVYKYVVTTVDVLLPPGSAGVSVTFKKNDVNYTPLRHVPVTMSGSSASVNLPYDLVKEDASVELVFRFIVDGKTQTRSVFVDVVTPVLYPEEIQTIGQKFATLSGSELKDLEFAARFAIQSYTGQKFGNFVGTRTVMGNGTNTLSLSEPLLRLDTIEMEGVFQPIGLYKIAGGGWFLTRPGNMPLDIKQAPPEEYFDGQVVGGVIFPPSGIGGIFYNKPYLITGEWGWRQVPEDVKLAAKYIVQDLSTKSSTYRQQYVEQMRSGSWSFTLNKKAFRGTGNSFADQLLDNYVKPGWLLV